MYGSTYDQVSRRASSRSKKIIQEENHHTFPGRIAHYVLKDGPSVATVGIWLLWKDIEMPDKATFERDVATFKA
jgi:hypothetical protein